MRIVVPTDFSDHSRATVRFAVSFARQAGAELVLLHVLPDFGPTLGTLPTTHLKENVLEWTESQFRDLAADIEPGEVVISHQITYGATVQRALLPFIEVHAIDLVIMGSHGAGGLKKFLLGSNTVEVINNVHIPVLVVPGSASTEPVTHLLYASDLRNIRDEALLLVPLARLLKAVIRIIHVPPLQYLELLDTQRILAILKKECGYEQIEMELIKGEDVQALIEQYAAAGNGKLLVLFTHHTRFLDQLFSKSITREIAWHHRIPLLTINSR